MYLLKSLILFTIIITFTAKLCSAVGSIELNLLSFRNDEGRLDDGSCCSDGAYQQKCSGPCKTFFRVCLKQFESKINVNSSCTFGEVITPVLGNNSVHLERQSNSIPGFTNPIRFPFNFSWPGMFTLIVEAWHETYYSSSAVNQLSKKLIIRYSASRIQKVNLIPTDKYQRSNYTELVYSYRVICDQNYYGEQCSTLCKPRDDSFGHYTCAPATGERECLNGWTGKFCTEPVCSSGCSKEHGYCRKPGECKCTYGWIGSNCTQCERYPGCVNGECGQPWECKCKPGWGGLLCNQDLNYCNHHNPCKNNGQCSNTGPGTYNCSCPSNFIGKNCEIEISTCELNPCNNNGVCKTLKGSLQNYTCICNKGFHGKNCEIQLGTCANKPCRNSENCVDGPSGALCICKPGYFGEHCEHRQTDCNPNPCLNGGQCNLNNSNNNNNNNNQTASNSSYTCSCLNGFTGSHCEIISQCALNPCTNDARCIDTPNGFKCICPSGFTSKDCSININDKHECESSPCLNDAKCIDKVNGFECVCKPNYFGALCENYKQASLGEHKSKLSSSRLVESKTIKETLRPVVVKVYNATPMITANQLPSTSAEQRPSAERLNSEQLIIISIISLIVPLSALLIFLVLRCAKRRNNLRNNNNNGLPCKSINEIEVIRQNETNNNLLNNSSLNNANNKLSTKLSNTAPGANVIVNSLNKASSVYSLNKAKSTTKLNNQQLNNENVYTSYPVNYTAQLRQQHNLYSTLNNNNRHSMYGMIGFNNSKQLSVYSADLNDNLKQQPLYATMKKPANPQFQNQMYNQFNNQLNNQLNNQKSIYETVKYDTAVNFGQPNDIYSTKQTVYNMPPKSDKY